MGDSSLISAIGTLAGVAIALIGVVGHYYRGMAKLRADMDAKSNELHGRITRVNDRQHKFERDAIERFASHGTLKDTEERLVKAIDRLTERIDQVLREMKGGA